MIFHFLQVKDERKELCGIPDRTEIAVWMKRVFEISKKEVELNFEVKAVKREHDNNFFKTQG